MKFHLSCLLMVVLIGSCSKSDSPTNSTSGNITGSVNLYDEGIVSESNEGMTVSIEGISPSVSAITNTEGKFLLVNVPFGTYTLVYSKAGYGTYKKFNVVHQANSLGYTYLTDQMSLGKLSTTTVNDLKAELDGDNLILTITTGGDLSKRRYIRRFYHNTPAVSSLIYTVDNGVTVLLPYSTQAIVSKSELNALGFASGTPLWIKVYGESFWSNVFIESGATVFPNLNAASADAVMVQVP